MCNKIVHIVLGKANPERLNGVNKVVHFLAESQFNIGYQVELWGISFSDSHNYPGRNFKTILFKDNKSKFRIDKNLKEQISKQDENTIFHFHGGFIPQFYSISRILNRKNLKYILTPHGAYNIIALEKSKLRKKIYITLFEKKLVRDAFKLHLIGKSEITGVNLIFGNKDYYLLQNGQNVCKATNINKNKKFIIGYCGRYDLKTKGLDRLIHAFNIFSDKYPNSELHLYGGGSDEERIKSIVNKANLEDKIKIHGPIYHQEKIIAFGSFNLFCLFSRNEGMPGVVLEALSTGTPCLVSNETNLKDYFGNSKIARSINCKSNTHVVNELAKYYEYLENNYFIETVIQCKTLIKENFNWNKIAIEHIKNYEEKSS